MCDPTMWMTAIKIMLALQHTQLLVGEIRGVNVQSLELITFHSPSFPCAFGKIKLSSRDYLFHAQGGLINNTTFAIIIIHITTPKY